MRRRTSSLALACGVAGLVALGTVASASAVTLEQIAPDGTYSAPMDVRSDPSNANRLFVAERDGRIQRTEGGTTTLFLDQTARTDTDGERGLLSFELAPDFATSGRYYVYYAGNGDEGTTQGTLYVDQLVDTGDPASPTRNNVITIPHPGQANHNGGALHFGPDGHLYLSTGDGGGGGDPNENAQNVNSRLGKLLRFDPKIGVAGHTSPSDNPFFGPTAGADEVWSYGLRNPFRWSFDRLTGDLTIGDVGQGSWEELDYQPSSAGGGRGVNFGWDCYEGRHDFELTDCPPITSTTQPVLEYPNPPAESAAVTGGYVSRDPGIPELYGRYLYADFFVGDIRSFVPALPDAMDDRSEGLTVGGPNAFGEDSCGRLYVVSLIGDQVYRIVGSTPTDCPDQPSPPQQPPAQPPSGDAKAPSLELGGDAEQHLGGSRRIKLTFTSDEAATLDIEGDVTAGSGKKRLFGLRSKRRQLQAGVKTTVTWRLSKRRARRLRRLVRHRRRVEASFAGSATDASGNASPTEHQVRLILH